MPGIAGDGSEDLPNIQHNNLCPEIIRPLPVPDYLLQKLHNAYGELVILTDNIQAIKPHHLVKLIELNAMIGNIMVWQLSDEEQGIVECKS